MTANEIALLLKKEKAIEVIGFMSGGMKIKEACLSAGIEPRTFEQYLAKFPEIQREFADMINARLAPKIDAIVNSKEKDIDALLRYQETLRERMEVGLLDDKAATQLMKVSTHLNETLKALLPATQQKQIALQEPSRDAGSAQLANTILADWRGANVKFIERTVEVQRTTLGSGVESAEEITETINVEASDVDTTILGDSGSQA